MKNIVLLLLIVLFLFFIIIIVIVSYENKIINTDNLKIYLYKETDFPLNIYFQERTRKNPKFKTLFKAVHKAIEKCNTLFDFEFFTINDNIIRNPNVLMIQIACGFHYGCVSTFDGKGGILAHATYPPRRKICVDCKDINFNPLYLIILHELGHIIGLTHTLDYGTSSLMQPFIDKRLNNFTEYDVERIKRRFKFLK